MKKIIFRLFIILFFTISIAITYLSTVGIETSRLNNQISLIIKNLDENLEVELKKVKIILNPIKLEINAKTLGPKFKFKDKSIELENINTQISINSFLNDNFSLKNLEVSTKSIEINKFISFIRNFKNNPEMFFLEKVIKKGYLISDIKLEFDEDGNIKDNYQVKGLIKDTKLNFFKKYNLDKINLNFYFSKNKFEFNEINLRLNNTQFSSKKIEVENLNKKLIIKGLIENENISLNDKIVKNFLEKNFSKIKFKNLIFDSKNQFFLEVSKKFKINKINLSSEIKLKNIQVANDLNLKKIFPNIKKEINLNNHLLNIDFDKDNLTIKGSGGILIQNTEDIINYNFFKKSNLLNFDTKLIIDKNPLSFNSLGYQKKPDAKIEIILKGTHNFNEKTDIELFSIVENKNLFQINQLSLDKNFKVRNFKKLDLNYLDKTLKKNQIKIIQQKGFYNLTGSEFNADSLIENLINNNDNKNLKIFNKGFDLNIKIDQVYLDNKHIINNLFGKLNFKNNEMVNAEINANFSNYKKFKFTVKTINQEKVTTLYLDQAEPLVKRYKFIKGYKGGSLDFNSSKKENVSTSNLKIYDFKLNELPILTKLLTLASLQGIADILSGEGITFDEFEMNFNNQKDLMTINEIYAIGPAISILMDGYVEKNKLVSLRGSLVPATTINKAIGNIPILGNILIGKKTGEGVFGVSFKIKGPPNNLETTVNPIKTLTPRFITRTLEKIKKN